MNPKASNSLAKDGECKPIGTYSRRPRDYEQLSESVSGIENPNCGGCLGSDRTTKIAGKRKRYQNPIKGHQLTSYF